MRSSERLSDGRLLFKGNRDALCEPQQTARGAVQPERWRLALQQKGWYARSRDPVRAPPPEPHPHQSQSSDRVQYGSRHRRLKQPVDGTQGPTAEQVRRHGRGRSNQLGPATASRSSCSVGGDETPLSVILGGASSLTDPLSMSTPWLSASSNLSTVDSSDIQWREKIFNEAAESVWDEDMGLDRAWYDNEESSYAVNNPYLDTSFRDDSGDKEESASIASKRKGRIHLRNSLRNADQELWELSRLRQSGIRGVASLSSNAPAIATSLYELPTGDQEEDFAVHVLVREVKPPFVDGRVQYTRQVDAVPTIREPTGDLATLAKRGSAIARHLRETWERTKMMKRFWEVAGSAMASVLGVRGEGGTKEELAEEREAAAMDSADDEAGTDGRSFRKKAQFAQFLGGERGRDGPTSAHSAMAAARRCLPIYSVRDELLELLRYNQVVVVIGQTGSGKTTQLPQFLHEEGYSRHGVVACTQPRRVAAVSVAKRVADEMGVELGREVGYAIRFEDCTSKATVLEYMTDGILLRQSLADPDLDRYSAVIMDEAHERSLNTDILFGVLRRVVTRRHDFRLVVTSATMNADKFAAFFGDCPVFDIPGRTFPVQIEYTRTPVDDYVDAAVQRCLQIHCSLDAADDSTERRDPGDILVFMTGQEDIEATCFLIADRVAKLAADKVAALTILPIYSTLPADLQARIFQKSSCRKVIVATNIAETSLTLDGVRFVIDCGYAKLKVYNPKVGMDSLQITPISQANAQQRAGRAGRTGPGVCFRLYTERAFVSELFENTIPEIQRTNLCHTVLLLKSLGIVSLLEFDFMDPPPQDAILNSMYQLWVLGALDDAGALTALGRKMAQFPLDPPLAKMLLTANELGCTAEILTVVAMLSVPSVFYRPRDRAEESDAAREKFFVPESDQVTMLHVYQQWLKAQRRPQWSTEHFVHQKAMKKVHEVRAQLLAIMETERIQQISSGTDWDIVRKAICSGYFMNAAKLRGIGGEYVNLRTAVSCYLHPSSALYGAGTIPEYIVYHEVILTSREFMQTVTAVEPQWLADLGPMFFYLKDSSRSSSNRAVRPCMPIATTHTTDGVSRPNSDPSVMDNSSRSNNFTETDRKRRRE